MSCRITIRLDNQMERALAERCQQSGQSASEVLRSALALLVAPPINPQRGLDSRISQPEAQNSEYAFPGALRDLLPRYRAFGLDVWAERRRRFCDLLASCEVARDFGKNATDDLALCVEVVRIGRLFRFLPG